MKYTNLSGWLIAIGVLLIAFKLVLTSVWSEAFMINLAGGNTALWAGLGLIVIGVGIMFLTKKEKRRKNKTNNGKEKIVD